MKSLFILTMVVILSSCQKDSSILQEPVEARGGPPKPEYIYTSGNVFSNCVYEYVHYSGKVGYVPTATRIGSSADISLQFSGTLQSYLTPSGVKGTIIIDDLYTLHITNTSFSGYQTITPIIVGGVLSLADGRLYGTRVFLTARVRSNLSVEISLDRFVFSCNKNAE